VQDATGAAVPGAEVKATQTDTGIVRIATTSAEGAYVLANLPIGPYRLEVTKQGFAAYEQTGIVLQVNTNPTIDFRLTVGAISEKVQVEAMQLKSSFKPPALGTLSKTSASWNCRSMAEMPPSWCSSPGPPYRPE